MAVKPAPEARLFRGKKGKVSYLEPRAAERHQHACERRATMSGVRAFVRAWGGGRCDPPDTVNAGANAQPVVKRVVLLRADAGYSVRVGKRARS